MISAAAFFTIVAGLIGTMVAVIFLVGIPREAKRKMEEKALETMGENKASYMLKGARLPIAIEGSGQEG